MDNPFERYDLDPREGIAAITRRLKELAEEARDEAERARIREAWEELTLHPARRLRAALFAHPETRAPLGTAPPALRRRASPEGAPGGGLELRDLAARPSVLDAIGALDAPDDDAVPSLEDDPVLRGRP
ncbi:MAG: hypothetical protein KF764_23085 [Labilithrix sp.]|nr:hypothetical protein [Labilithrix sp.]MBX3221279.1 hypothetical protein [Labilithrix sp.]